MRWSDLQLNPSARLLRQFAGLWVLVFSGLALRQWSHGHIYAAGLIGTLAVTVGSVGLMFPSSIRPVFIAWTVLAYPIGWMVSRFSLALLFYGVLTPLGLAFRLMRRDCLQLGPRRRESYWTPKATSSEAMGYFRQY